MTFQRIMVVLTKEEMSALRDAAVRDLRTPRNQARHILRSVLFSEDDNTITKPTEGFAVWWLSQRDCELLGDVSCDDPDEEIGLPDYGLPRYIRIEYMSLSGRNARGRLWVSLGELGKERVWEIPHELFENNSLGVLLEKDYGGIVIRERDALAVAYLPGLVTDFKLNFLNVPPWTDSRNPRR